MGCLASSLVHPREVMKPAILASAACLVLAHNHPSGVMRKSPLCGLRRGLDLVATWGLLRITRAGRSAPPGARHRSGTLFRERKREAPETDPPGRGPCR